MLVVLRLKDKQNPDKVWDTHNNFIAGTQDATTLSDYTTKFNAKSDDGNYTVAGFRARWYLTDNKKQAINIYIGSKELWEFDWTNYWQPHIDKNLLEIEKLVEAEVFIPVNANGTFDWEGLPLSPAGIEMKKLVDLQTDELDWDSMIVEWAKVQPLA
tara:strand:+ start:2668 stop:3138 length:471 start_codon:yes stop_codon:yes gene_type:complete